MIAGPLAIALVSSLLLSCPPRLPSRPHDLTVGTQAVSRPFKGRLYFDELYRPYLGEQPPPLSRQPERATPSRGAGPSYVTGLISPPAGTRMAVSSGLEATITRLSQAVVLDPASPQAHNDLAVALLQRGDSLQRPLDLLAALRHCLVAAQRAPLSPAVQFNLALALDALFVRHEAKRALLRCIELDGGSDWAQEARRRYVGIAAEPARLRLRYLEDLLLSHQPVSAAALREIVAQYPDRAREIAIENLLPAAASELAAPLGGFGEAAKLMADLAHEMELQRHDQTLSGAMAALDTAHAAHLSLVRPHRLMAEGMRLYHEGDFRAAAQQLAAAATLLRAAGSPVAWEAELYHAICTYYSRSGYAWRPLKALLADLDQRRFPSLAGRTLWMLGTIAMVQGRHQEAIPAFQLMRQLLLQGGGELQAAAADLLFAENYDLRGEVERGWDHRLAALRALIPGGPPRRRHSILIEAAEALARRHQSDLALAFLDEAIDNDQRWPNAAGRAEALWVRARVRAESGNAAGAAADAASALAAVADMPPGKARLRLEGQALVSRGEARLAADPAAAAADLERGLALELATGWQSDHALVLTSLAAANLALGDTDAARKSLREAVYLFERMRGQAMETESRIAIFEHAQEAFEALTRLAAADPSTGLDEAFYWVERSRARYLADSWAARRSATQWQTAGTAGSVRRLPAGVTLVEIAVLPECTIVWVAEDGRLRGRLLPYGRAEMGASVDGLRRALESRAPSFPALSADLYDRLLRPVEPFGRGARQLVIVPDSPLDRVPFAALYDRSRAQYLIERMAVTMAPSATMLDALAARRRTPALAGARSALIVGAPDLSRTAHAEMGVLPGAVAEAQAVAALLPRHVLLVAREATRARFLRELPKSTVMHFAGHALAGSSLSDASLLLLAPDAPFGAGDVSAGDIRALSLTRTDLVVLAACRSMAGYSPGREGPLSLASAFLAAGVPSVVAALWDVDDRSAPRLIQEFHALTAAGVSPADALRTVMLRSLHSRDPELSSPSTWAVFAALGI